MQEASLDNGVDELHKISEAADADSLQYDAKCLSVVSKYLDIQVSGCLCGCSDARGRATVGWILGCELQRQNNGTAMTISCNSPMNVLFAS